MKIKLKKNETFTLRDGWLEKGLNIIKDNNEAFKGDVTTLFGLGSNMVKALKYYLEAANLIQVNKKVTLTDFGKSLCECDLYLENIISWYLIHYHFVINKDLCPVINAYFNNNFETISKNNLLTKLSSIFSSYENLNLNSLDNDITVMLRSYTYTKSIDPEYSSNSPLSTLKLIKKNDDDSYSKTSPDINSLPLGVIYYVIQEYNKKVKSVFTLEDYLKEENNLLNIFNLTKSSLYYYLDLLHTNKLINLVKTAGLNTIEVRQMLSLKEIYNLRRKLNV